MDRELQALILNEGWKTTVKNGKEIVVVNGNEYPVTHPFAIWSKIYREEDNPELKYQALKRMHDLMWPQFIPTWNYWDERRFRRHCSGHKCITYAGGASTAKSHCAARIAILFWLADPAHRTVIVASTTLESLNSRIFGYCIRFLDQAKVNVDYTYRQGMPPKILFDTKDKIHGIYALAAKQGDDDKAIRDIIGRHPDRGMMVVLDESTDMPVALLNALPNLEAGGIEFQLVAIGNSNNKFDLHGSLSTPRDGWNSIDPMKQTEWETTQKDGICLFFSCYESPAIFETDPVKKELLSKFLITQEQIDSKIKLYGAKSDSFWRFVLGFWRMDGSGDDLVLSKVFLNEFNVRRLTEWSGAYPLQIIGGLDPAFSTGGDDCILRLAVLGQEVSGKIVLDFRGEELIFKIPILANTQKSAELQIAEKVLEILASYNVTLNNVAIDATGQGRALGEVIKLRARIFDTPIKIYSTKFGSSAQKSFDVDVKTTLELWTDIRDFIQTDQIRGLDEETITQLTSRLISLSEGGKRSLESKAKYKARMQSISPSLAHSPDRADAAALCLQAAKMRFAFVPGQKRDIVVQQSFDMEKWHASIMEGKAREQETKPNRGYPVADFSADLTAFCGIGWTGLPK